ncbi:PAS domain-containing response regulator [Sideroxydans lithotrophicus]|uniref:histidine kinase n=1 Tax=Sideroxydans lithotrophicus (strain ES-1) TaxID=580332 RepID=D5CPQ6_SIDLE|nr:PAS domain S-box protein [Sideroxydans lithotrophicus]ADE13051.1 putative PAS/PAC sensor protein [Sideroxydans lithotrophicus ES-1]
MTKPQIHVLIVEDDVVDRMACRRSFAQDTHDFEFVLVEAETARDGLQLVHTEKLDCVLLDYNLPDLNGLEFLAELKDDLGAIPLPVIMLTGADNAAVAVEAIKLGAQDYVVKDPNLQYLELLPAVIERVLREQLALKEKQLMESSLARAEAKYRSLVEQIPAITYSTALNVTGKLIYISPQIRQLGYAPEELLADPEGILKLLHPEDRTGAYTQISHCYESGEPLRCECRLLTREGKVRWFLNEAVLVRHESEEPLFLQGILIDITKDKEVEEELQQHRRRLEELVESRTVQFERRIAILESANANLVSKLGECTQAGSAQKKCADQFADLYHNAPCGCHSLDLDGVFVQVNDTELAWLGLAREEVVGKIRLTDILTPASVKKFQDSYRHFKEHGWVRNLELEIVRKDGARLPVLLNANAVKDKGRFVMSRSVVFDITGFKRTGQ